jgi:S-formylglutathione hydrolase FrmB
MIPDKAVASKSDKPFRIVYLLHGLHGDQGTWLDNTMLAVYAKKYNAVFVMPEVGRSFYANQKYGRKYSDYVGVELPQICRRIFNISAKREDTAIMGCSMGGYGSLWFSLSKPEAYGFCGAISSACLNTKDMLEALRRDPDPFLKHFPEAEEIYTDLRSIYGEGLEYNPDYDIKELVRKFPAAMPKPVIYMACGTEDDLHKENLVFKDEMGKTDFDFTYEEWPGNHEWFFFNEALKKTLEFWYAKEKKE